MYLGDKYANEDNDKADLFTSHFATVYFTKIASRLAMQNVDCILGSAKISREGLLKALTQIDANKEVGDPDGISPLFLKECAKPFVEALHIIFNLSLKNGCFSICMKSSYITPVYKDGDPQDVSRYCTDLYFECDSNAVRVS